MQNPASSFLRALRRCALLLTLGVATLAFAACDADDGPAEQAGQEADELADDDNGENGPMEQAGEDIDEAYDHVTREGGSLDQAGDDIAEAVDEASPE